MNKSHRKKKTKRTRKVYARNRSHKNHSKRRNSLTLSIHDLESSFHNEILFHYHLQSMLSLYYSLAEDMDSDDSYNLYRRLLPHTTALYSLVNSEYAQADFTSKYAVLLDVVEKIKKHFTGEERLAHLSINTISAIISALANLWEYFHTRETQSLLYTHYDICGIHAYITEIVRIFEAEGIECTPIQYSVPPRDLMAKDLWNYLQQPDEMLKLRLSMQNNILNREALKN